MSVIARSVIRLKGESRDEAISRAGLLRRVRLPPVAERSSQ